MRNPLLALVLVVLSACSGKRVHEEPILENGDRVSEADATVETSRARAEADRAVTADLRDSLTARALADCTPEVCEAVVGGEVAPNMTPEQVMAATRTTRDAWSIRQADGATVMVPRSLSDPPSDRVADLTLVQLRAGRVERYGYRDGQGLRVVSTPEDATTDGHAEARAERLIREGDALVAAGDLDAALDRYDRADILTRTDPRLDYRIARVLDKQLRPIEALIRYRLFLHRLELERIGAVGDAYAKLAEAIAHAKERIVVLERRTR